MFSQMAKTKRDLQLDLPRLLKVNSTDCYIFIYLFIYFLNIRLYKHLLI